MSTLAPMPTRETTTMLLSFLFVGGSFSLGYSLVVAGLIGLGAPAFWTSLVLYGICIPLAFLAQRKLTFQKLDARRGAFWVYLATQLGSFALVSAITSQFVTQVFWKDTALFLATAACAAVASFVVNRSFAFTTRG